MSAATDRLRAWGKNFVQAIHAAQQLHLNWKGNYAQILPTHSAIPEDEAESVGDQIDVASDPGAYTFRQVGNALINSLPDGPRKTWVQNMMSSGMPVRARVDVINNSQKDRRWVLTMEVKLNAEGGTKRIVIPSERIFEPLPPPLDDADIPVDVDFIDFDENPPEL